MMWGWNGWNGWNGWSWWGWLAMTVSMVAFWGLIIWGDRGPLPQLRLELATGRASRSRADPG